MTWTSTNKTPTSADKTPTSAPLVSAKDALHAKIDIALQRALVNIEQAIPFHAIEQLLLSDSNAINITSWLGYNMWVNLNNCNMTEFNRTTQLDYAHKPVWMAIQKIIEKWANERGFECDFYKVKEGTDSILGLPSDEDPFTPPMYMLFSNPDTKKEE
jgi:hypothetical protein